METALFSSEIQELPSMLKWLQVRLEERGVEKKMVGRLELALEEAVVNIISHGYRGNRGKIELGFQWSSDCAELFVRDWGPPFDPLTNAPKVDLETTLEKREQGRLGIYLMKQIVDEMRYFRENDTNVLVLIKRFSRTK